MRQQTTIRATVTLALLALLWTGPRARGDWVMTDKGKIEGQVRRLTSIGVDIMVDRRPRFVRSESVTEIISDKLGPTEAAAAAFRAGQFTKAVPLLEEVEKKVDQSWYRGRIRYQLVLACLASGQATKARQKLTALIQEDADAIWLGLAPLPVTVKRWPTGTDRDAAAAAAKAEKSHAALCFAKVIAATSGNADLVKVPPAHPDPYSGQICQMAEAFVLLKAGDARAALTKLGDTEKYDARFRAQAHFVCGLAQGKTGNTTEAVLSLLRAGYVYPTRFLVAGPACGMAVDLLIAAGRKAEAGQIAADVMRQYPFVRKM